MNLLLRAKNTGQLNIDRVFARLFLAMGGAFWVIAFFAAHTSQSYSNLSGYTLPELANAAEFAFLPFALVVVVFALGFFYERLTGLVLVLAAIAMIGWGILEHWGADGIGLWITAFSVLILPTIVASALFELAARRQERQELEAKVATA